MNDLYDKLKCAIHNVVVRFLSRATMKNTGRCLFVDKVNGREVWLYIDKYGKEWMAQSKWGMRCAK
jgi:hypothetical protein